MARSKKLIYRTIGFPPDVFKQLQEEANRYHLPFPTYITALHIDREEALQGQGRGLWFPRGVPLIQTIPPPPIQTDEEDTVKMKAVSAAAAWDAMD